LVNKVRPSFEAEWFYAVKDEISRIAEKTDFDVILSSSPPESAHMVAAMLKDLTAKPWIADLRDLWADDHYRNLDAARKCVAALTEKKVLGRADAIVTVSETWARRLGERYKDKVRVVTNSFDPDFFASAEPGKGGGVFSVSYLGKLNGRHQDVKVFLEGVRDFIREPGVAAGSVEVNFYVSGYNKPDIAEIAADYGLSGIVKEREFVPVKDSFGVMSGSDLLVIFGWKGVSSKGWRPEKIYEYMGSGTPVLLVGGSENPELAGLIRETGIGAAADGAGGVCRALAAGYKNRGHKKLAGVNAREVAKYSAVNTAARLADIINGLAVKR